MDIEPDYYSTQILRSKHRLVALLQLEESKYMLEHVLLPVSVNWRISSEITVLADFARFALFWMSLFLPCPWLSYDVRIPAMGKFHSALSCIIYKQGFFSVLCLSFMKNLLKGTKYYINRAIGIAIKCMYITFRIRYEQSLLGRSTVKFQDIRKIASKRGL